MPPPPPARIVLAFLAGAGIIFICLQANGHKNQREPADIRNLWRSCMSRHLGEYKNDHSGTWSNITHIADSCAGVLNENFEIAVCYNKDEQKYHILPPTSKTTTLTVGVGNDIDAELELKKKLDDNVEMFGADPITEINEDLFQTIGAFYPFAVGAKAGVSQASVYINKTYTPKTLVHIDFMYFLQHVIRRKFFDALWLDAEGAEYEMLTFFLRGGVFDKNSVTFCQINLEIHYPNDELRKKAHDFFFSIIEDGRYAIYKALNVGHHRVYMINLEDSACLSRYRRLAL